MYDARTSFTIRRAVRRSVLALLGVALFAVWWAADTNQAGAEATVSVPPSPGIVVQPEMRVIYPGLRTGPDEL